jgi:hypothetical protein
MRPAAAQVDRGSRCERIFVRFAATRLRRIFETRGSPRCVAAHSRSDQWWSHEFLPKLEEGNMWVRALLPPTVTLPAGVDSVARMRKILLSYAPVRTVISEQGRRRMRPIPTAPSSPNIS